MRMRHSSVHIGKNTVTKTALPELMRVEVEKTRRAFKIGKQCGLFRVPEVLDYNEAKGVAVFERLQMKPISQAVPWGDQRIRLVKHLGASLAIIHREMTLPDDMRTPLPQEFFFPHDEVFIHGDLTVDNVCVGDSWPPIVIIDWQLTPLYGGRSTYGTRYFDMLWFIRTLISRFSSRFLFGNPVMPAAKVFFGAYFREAKLDPDFGRIEKYAASFFEVEMLRIKQIWGKGRLVLPVKVAILREFIDFLKAANSNDGLLREEKDYFG